MREHVHNSSTGTASIPRTESTPSTAATANATATKPTRDSISPQLDPLLFPNHLAFTTSDLDASSSIKDRKIRVTFKQHHWARKQAILQAHPELRSLHGPHTPTFFILVGMVLLLHWMAWLCRDTSWWLTFFVAWFVGAFLSHSLWMLFHECTHNVVCVSLEFLVLFNFFFFSFLPPCCCILTHSRYFLVVHYPTCWHYCCATCRWLCLLVFRSDAIISFTTLIWPRSSTILTCLRIGR